MCPSPQLPPSPSGVGPILHHRRLPIPRRRHQPILRHLRPPIPRLCETVAGGSSWAGRTLHQRTNNVKQCFLPRLAMSPGLCPYALSGKHVTIMHVTPIQTVACSRSGAYRRVFLHQNDHVATSRVRVDLPQRFQACEPGRTEIPSTSVAAQ